MRVDAVIGQYYFVLFGLCLHDFIGCDNYIGNCNSQLYGKYNTGKKRTRVHCAYEDLKICELICALSNVQIK